MIPITWPNKLPGEVYSIELDWRQVLQGAAILSCDASVKVGAGLLVTHPEKPSFQGMVQTIWLSGGIRGRAVVLCTIHTDDQRTLQCEAQFQVLS